MLGSDEMTASLPSCARNSRLVQVLFNVQLSRFRKEELIPQLDAKPGSATSR